MTKTRYEWWIAGVNGDGVTWSTSGIVAMPDNGTFMQALDAAMSESFNRLTNGNAIFGIPGEGCAGPYHLTKLHIEKIEE